MKPYGITPRCGYAVTQKQWKRLGRYDKLEVDDLHTKRLRHRARRAGQAEASRAMVSLSDGFPDLG